MGVFTKGGRTSVEEGLLEIFIGTGRSICAARSISTSSSSRRRLSTSKPRFMDDVGDFNSVVVDDSEALLIMLIRLDELLIRHGGLLHSPPREMILFVFRLLIDA